MTRVQILDNDPNLVDSDQQKRGYTIRVFRIFFLLLYLVPNLLEKMNWYA